MKICSQCHGNGKVVSDVGRAMNAPNSGTFTDATTERQYACPSCLGNGYQNCFGAN